MPHNFNTCRHGKIHQQKHRAADQVSSRGIWWIGTLQPEQETLFLDWSLDLVGGAKERKK